MMVFRTVNSMFQHTAARRRLDAPRPIIKVSTSVSTHSRPKAAGQRLQNKPSVIGVSTHSRPKAAGDFLRFGLSVGGVSTHSRPKAAGPHR